MKWRVVGYSFHRSIVSASQRVLVDWRTFDVVLVA